MKTFQEVSDTVEGRSLYKRELRTPAQGRRGVLLGALGLRPLRRSTRRARATLEDFQAVMQRTELLSARAGHHVLQLIGVGAAVAHPATSRAAASAAANESHFLSPILPVARTGSSLASSIPGRGQGKKLSQPVICSL